MQTNRLYWSLLLILATCCGLGITALTLRQAASPSIALGAWLTDPLAGNTKADLYTRARIAVTGLFALDKSETLYFVARQDDKGQALRSRCQYRISGVQPAARWWSITAYADDISCLMLNNNATAPAPVSLYLQQTLHSVSVRARIC
jgi:hypothetical protein